MIMITREDIKATMEEILETFPRLKEDIIEDRPFIIRKKEEKWKCLIVTKYSQFGDQPGLIATKFDLEGNPIELLVSNFGRPMIYYFHGRDENGKFIGSSEPQL